MTPTQTSAKSFRVVVSDRFDAQAFERVAQNLLATRAQAPSLEHDDLSSVDGLLIRSRTPITGALLERAPVLKVIVTSTSGFDHIDLKACQEAGVKVMYTPNANAASACELTWGLVVMAARKLPLAHTMIEAGNWNREPLMGRQLGGKTYGVIGFGRIGRRVADVAHALGMKVIAYDPFIRDFGAAQSVSLAEIFQMADVVSVHVPATRATTHMISRELLQRKLVPTRSSGRIFVNASRGAVIEDSTLIEALDQGWISACGLDVFETEPLPRDSRLLKRDNVVLSPHIGATTHEAFQTASMEAADKMLAFAQHGSMSDELPGQLLWMDRD